MIVALTCDRLALEIAIIDFHLRKLKPRDYLGTRVQLDHAWQR